MSALAKVLVVLNLVLVLFFVGVSSTLFTTRKNWKEASEHAMKQYENDVKAVTTVNSTLRDQLGVQKTNNTSLRGERDSLQAKRNELEGEIASLSNNLKDLDSQLKTTNQNLQDRQSAYEEQVARNDRLEKDLQAARADQVAAQNAKQDAETRRARAMLDAQQLAKQSSELSKELASAREELQEKSELIAAAIDNGVDFSTMFAIKPPPPISGVVAAVSPDVNLVVLDVGADDEVKHGYEFTIYRGDRFIGKAKVQNVLDDMAGARVLFVEDGEQVRQGDRVSTRVGS
ncbi:MAG: hypothetical protein AAF581_12190 [Planctomycetota bacterium]